ncbi:hypothetical protein EI94DRAFT_1734199 [Lactarius quietus]|nr:hypothetical protein EI94DRAFT_1734199 [Lactarius quietus]
MFSLLGMRFLLHGLTHRTTSYCLSCILSANHPTESCDHIWLVLVPPLVPPSVCEPCFPKAEKKDVYQISQSITPRPICAHISAFPCRSLYTKKGMGGVVGSMPMSRPACVERYLGH